MPSGGGLTMSARPGPPKAPKSFCAPWAAKMIPTMTGTTPAHQDCPATRAIDLVAHKWTMHILFTLRQAGQPVRFRRLQQMIEPITQKELTKRLRQLERSGLVHRQVYAEVPPRVEYR